MIPGVCLALFGLCVMLLFLILIPIAGAAFTDDIRKAMEKDAEERHEEQTASVLAVLIVSWFFFAICAGLLSLSQWMTHANQTTLNLFPFSPHFCSDWMACLVCHVHIVQNNERRRTSKCHVWCLKQDRINKCAPRTINGDSVINFNLPHRKPFIWILPYRGILYLDCVWKFNIQHMCLFIFFALFLEDDSWDWGMKVWFRAFYQFNIFTQINTSNLCEWNWMLSVEFKYHSSVIKIANKNWMNIIYREITFVQANSLICSLSTLHEISCPCYTWCLKDYWHHRWPMCI